MNRTPDKMTVGAMIAIEDDIDPKPDYQRGPAWSDAKRTLLIDSVLRDLDIGPIYLRPVSGDYDYEVVDGQQRLTALWRFRNGDLCLDEVPGSLGLYGDLEGVRWPDLHADAKQRLTEYVVQIVLLENASESETRLQFLRLQEGVALNSAERRNAMSGNLRDFIAERGQRAEMPHRVFEHVDLKPNRLWMDDWLAHVICLELADGPTKVNGWSLAAMYHDKKEISLVPLDSDLKHANTVLNYMARVLKSDPPEMRIKWGFVDLYLAVSKLHRAYNITGREDAILKFFVDFEQERAASTDRLVELAESGDPWDRDMFEYIQVFRVGGAKKSSVETRHGVYIRRLLRAMPDLRPKDSRRRFSRTQRMVIWRRDKMKCRLQIECDGSEELSFEEMHADHVTPWSASGQTTVENSQTACAACNLKKSDSIA